MNKFPKYAITAFGFAAVLYPLWVRFQHLQWDASLEGIALNLFPFFGLAAVAMLWIHSISGAFELWLRQHINFDRFVDITAKLILICLVMHPLLLFAGVGFNISNIFFYYGTLYVWLGIISWLLLIIYDITKPFKQQGFFAKHWKKVLVISNMGFLLSFFHSLNIGSDLQSGPLRVLWIFYGVTGALAILYTYGIKRFLAK